MKMHNAPQLCWVRQMWRLQFVSLTWPISTFIVIRFPTNDANVGTKYKVLSCKEILGLDRIVSPTFLSRRRAKEFKISCLASCLLKPLIVLACSTTIDGPLQSNCIANLITQQISFFKGKYITIFYLHWNVRCALWFASIPPLLQLLSLIRHFQICLGDHPGGIKLAPWPSFFVLLPIIQREVDCQVDSATIPPTLQSS